MKMPKAIYVTLAKYQVRLKAVAASFEARNKVAMVSSSTFSEVCYDVIRADKNGYNIDVEIDRMDAVYQLLAMGVLQEDVLYLVDHNRKREFVRVLAFL